MNLLLYKDLIINFFTQNITSTEHQRLTRKIFENENSVFLYSKKFLQFIRKELGDEYEDEFQTLVKKIGDNGENINSSEITANFDEEFLHIYENTPTNVLISISLSKPNEIILKAISNIAIIDQCRKPNYHWLVVDLAIFHPNKVSVNCLDFQDNSDVKQFFDDVFNLPKSISRMNIFARQTNQFNHDKFNLIKDVVSVFYYTYQHQHFSQDESSIRANFRRLTIYTTRNRRHQHGRRLIFEGFVLSADHDFNELEVDGDWEIDILYSQSEANRWMSRCSRFRIYR